jgi:peptidoglycan/LPS O-acetylase OafA/YrhL
MFHHFGLRLRFVSADGLVAYGWSGVDLFFVLSGFLITRILLDSKTAEGYFKNFYARRALRIWPLYYALLVFAFVIFPVIVEHNAFLRSYYVAPVGGAWIYFGAFLQNFWMSAHPPVPMLAATWSLAVEEQFYIVWPWLVLLLGEKALAKILTAALVLSPIIRAIAVHYGVGGFAIYNFSIFRLDGLIVGALIALWARSSSFSLARLRNAALPLLVLGAIGGTWLAPSAITNTAPNPLTYSALAILFGAALGLALTAKPGGIPHRILTCRPMRYTGKVSYCLYLVHLPVFVLLNSNAFQRRFHFGSPALTDITVLVIGFAVVYAIAALSWYGLETRVLAFKSYFECKSTEAILTAKSSAACSLEA